MAVGDISQKQILAPAEEYLNLNQATAVAEASRRAQNVANRLGVGFLLLGMCGSVAGLLAGYTIARGVRRSLAQMSIPIRDATGSLGPGDRPDSVLPRTRASTRWRPPCTRSPGACRPWSNAFRPRRQCGSRAASGCHGTNGGRPGSRTPQPAHFDEDPGSGGGRAGWSGRAGSERPGGIPGGDRATRSDYSELSRLCETAATGTHASHHSPSSGTDDRVGPVARTNGWPFTSTAGSLPRLFKSKRTRAKSVRYLLNLLLNAIDASPEGETIIVRMHFESGRGTE